MKETRMTLSPDQIQFPPRTAQVLRSPAGHEVVYGMTGSGKTHRVKKLIADDMASGHEVWVIDPLGGVALPGRTEEVLTDLKVWLSRVAVVRFDPSVRPRPLVVTIDEAFRVLEDYSCRRLIEKALVEARGRDLRLRLVVQSLMLSCFGGSKLIRSALLDGAEAVA